MSFPTPTLLSQLPHAHLPHARRNVGKHPTPPLSSERGCGSSQYLFQRNRCPSLPHATPLKHQNPAPEAGNNVTRHPTPTLSRERMREPAQCHSPLHHSLPKLPHARLPHARRNVGKHPTPLLSSKRDCGSSQYLFQHNRYQTKQQNQHAPAIEPSSIQPHKRRYTRPTFRPSTHHPRRPF